MMGIGASARRCYWRYAYAIALSGATSGPEKEPRRRTSWLAYADPLLSGDPIRQLVSIRHEVKNGSPNSRIMFDALLRAFIGLKTF
jgi:hypothetical protein